MAFIIVDGKRQLKTTPAQIREAVYLWKILKGEVKPLNKAWERYAARVSRIYLNPTNPLTPRSYIEERRQLVPDTSTYHREQLSFVETRKDLM